MDPCPFLCEPYMCKDQRKEAAEEASLSGQLCSVQFWLKFSNSFFSMEEQRRLAISQNCIESFQYSATDKICCKCQICQRLVEMSESNNCNEIHDHGFSPFD